MSYCAVRSHLRSGLGFCLPATPVCGTSPHVYVPPPPAASSGKEEYAGIPGFPCTPQPRRRRKSENGELDMKFSSLMCQDAEMTGNLDHLWPAANLDEPSYRSAPVTK